MNIFENKKVFIFAVNAYTAALARVAAPNAAIFVFRRNDSRLFRLMTILYVLCFGVLSRSKSLIYLPHFESLFQIFRVGIFFAEMRIIDDGTTLLERSVHNKAFIRAAKNGVICGLENHYFQANSYKVPRTLVVKEMQRIYKQSDFNKEDMNCLVVGDGIFDRSIIRSLKHCGIIEDHDTTIFKKHPSQHKKEVVNELPAELFLTNLSGGLLVGRMSTVLLNCACFDNSIRVFTISNPENYELSNFFIINETDYTLDLKGTPNRLYEIKRLPHDKY
jgi:hypothetical protein